MHQPASALPANFVLAREAYGDDAPRWVVRQAEAEIVRRYGGLDRRQLGLTAAMFDPPRGALLAARRDHAAGPRIGGVGVRTVDSRSAEGARRGEIRRLWVDPARRRHGVARRLMDAVEQESRPANSAATGFRSTKKLAGLA
jgi:GNAT superfamily N-acetyltransferase